MRTVALTLLVTSLAVAGCGSSGKSPAVASLAGSSTPQSTTPSPDGFSTGAPRAGSGGFHVAMRANLKFSQCMRAHGVPNYPDPSSSGIVAISSGSGLDPSAPAFQSAVKNCQKNLPNGGQPTPQQLARAKQDALAYSACMRAHGIRDFPDPNFSGGGVSIRLGGPAGNDLNPGNPTFAKAQTACRGLFGLPKG